MTTSHPALWSAPISWEMLLTAVLHKRLTSTYICAGPRVLCRKQSLKLTTSVSPWNCPEAKESHCCTSWLVQA